MNKDGSLKVRVPPSKSVTQRALILAAMGDVECKVRNILDCDDSRALSRGLEAFGVKIKKDDTTWTVLPPKEYVTPERAIDLENAGTAVRFLTGLSLVLPGPFTIDGNQAMRKRPMPSLLRALRSAGVSVRTHGLPDCPPVTLNRAEEYTPAAGAGAKHIRIRAEISSQEVSALLLAGPALACGLELEVSGDIPSKPYLDLTISVMSDFGIQVEESTPGEFHVPSKKPASPEYEIEGDWSSASYVLAAALLTGKKVTLEGVKFDSAQGDRAVTAILERLKRPGNVVLDMRHVPDLVPTVCALSVFRKHRTKLSNISHLKYKESDRIAVLARELRKTGANIEAGKNDLVIHPSEPGVPATLDPHGDHRMAMAFGLVSLKAPGIGILDRDCVSKSYPGFWDMLELFK